MIRNDIFASCERGTQRRSSERARTLVVAKRAMRVIVARRKQIVFLLGVFFLGLFAKVANAEHPRDASNFQGKHPCTRGVRSSTPKSIRDVSEIVRQSESVRANGAGHSWHPGLYCPARGGTRVDLLNVRSVESSTRWILDERARVVRGDAGLLTRDLLDGLASRGYTLPAFPWFIDQTIGGAVATASHGSSLRAGSLSSQLVAVTVVLADGSVEHYAEGKTSPALFESLRANVGRLGVVVDVSLRVVENSRITRNNEDIAPDAFVVEMFRVQAATRACAKQYPDDLKAQWSCAMSKPEVRALDETQYFWYTPLQEMSRITFQREKPGALNFTAYDERSASSALSSVNFGSLSSGSLVRDSPPRARDITSPVTLMGSEGMASAWARTWKRATLLNIAPVTDEQRDSFLSMTEEQYLLHERYGYEQLEVAVPFTKAGDCMQAFKTALYDDRELNLGFRSQALLRFIQPESAWLSPAHGRLGTLYINIEDFVKYSRVFDTLGNPRFDAAVAILRGDKCDGRLHWGKFGFPKRGCFDGAKEYGVSFCHFGCQVSRLDPTNKFLCDSDALQFSGIDFAACCGTDGLFVENTTCKCVLNDRIPADQC